MIACVNKSSIEYQTLKNRSGIHPMILDALCRESLDKYDRFPYLDELPSSNSEPSLRELISVKDNGEASIDRVLEATNSNTVEESVIKINNEFRDLEVEILPINKSAIVDIAHRPTINNFEAQEVEQDQEVYSPAFFRSVIYKLQRLYGINVIETNNIEIEAMNLGIDSGVNAFIQNGNIYINTDLASVDAPIHEMMHLLIGQLRFYNPNLYQELVQSVEQFPSYKKLAAYYYNRSRNDINEEIFVTEVSKYLAGMPTNLNLDEKAKHEILYNVNRLLDSILMGQSSVNTVTPRLLYNMSLKQAAQMLGSVQMINTFKGTPNDELHRKLNNEKSDLIKQKELIEQCK